jgi:hypothetical protein
MQELTDTKLARPMDPTGLSNDHAVLRNLLDTLNNPAITGAQPPVTPKAKRPSCSVPSPLPVSEPAPPPPQKTMRIAFTGYSRAGKSWLAEKLGAKTLEFSEPAVAMITPFVKVPPPELIGEIMAWGDGYVSPKYPMTAARIAIMRVIAAPDGEPRFGVPGYWFKLFERRLKAERGRVVVTNIYNSGQHKALRGLGFSIYHVMTSATTRSERRSLGHPDSKFTTEIEQAIVQQFSHQPNGDKLPAIWCDDKQPLPSGRLFSVNEFLAKI